MKINFDSTSKQRDNCLLELPVSFGNSKLDFGTFLNISNVQKEPEVELSRIKGNSILLSKNKSTTHNNPSQVPKKPRIFPILGKTKL